MMRDHDDGAIGQNREDGIDKALLGLGVKPRKRLVQNHDGRCGKQDARKRNTMALATRETLAALVDQRIKALRQALKQIAKPHMAQRAHKLLIRSLQLPQPQVIAQRPVEQMRVLLNNAYLGGEAASVR